MYVFWFPIAARIIQLISDKDKILLDYSHMNLSSIVVTQSDDIHFTVIIIIIILNSRDVIIPVRNRMERIDYQPSPI